MRHSQAWTIHLCALCILLLTISYAHATVRAVIYPRPESTLDKRTEYPLKLLEFALKSINTQYTLIPTSIIINQGRALEELSNARTVDVVWSMTSVERERKLLPIRIPIHRGLIGWRLFLVKDSRQKAISDIDSLAELKQRVSLQGHDWPDTKILQSNGFNVVGVVHYPSIFEMLKKERGDLFPRSIIEIWAEADTHKNSGIVIEPKFLLRYPAAFYYFVSRTNSKLAKDIEAGLHRLIENGEYNRVFYQYYGNILEKTNLPNRTIFDLSNPILPTKTPLDDEQLWHK